MFGLETNLGILFIASIIAACVFEFVNGFHDTANAVATVIYTRSLKPYQAVIWSGFCNFLGVMFGGIGVAMGIIKLLPLIDMANAGIHEGIALLLGMIVSAIIWNLFTWKLGLPCSSSHTMIGSIIGVGLMFSYFHSNGDGIDWTKAIEIGASLLVSPLFGFASAIVLMFLGRQFLKGNKSKRDVIFNIPSPNSVPPTWIRIILFITCTSVSFFHGSNDGQKGVGLVLIILMTFFPLQYALNSNFSPDELSKSIINIERISKLEGIDNVYQEIDISKKSIYEFTLLNNTLNKLKLRKNLIALTKSLGEELKLGKKFINTESKSILKVEIENLKKNFEFVPFWVILMISLSLGIGTTIGWKRIVVTIGEKIGKSHLTYAEGAAAEIVAAITIGLSSGFGLPVSTTHVLSSGVAGAITATKGVKNLQANSIKNIGIAWVLTLPVCMILSASLYWIFRIFI